MKPERKAKPGCNPIKDRRSNDFKIHLEKAETYAEDGLILIPLSPSCLFYSNDEIDFFTVNMKS